MKREIGSHLSADIAGWRFAAGYGEVLAGLHATAFMNSQRDSKKQPEPIRLPVPWPSENEAEQVTEEERVKARANLMRRSAFADR